MKVLPTAIPDVLIVEPKVFGDERGFFIETWHARRYGDAGLRCQFVQDNHSRSAGGVLRGLHYQISQAQGKLVQVVSGEVFDVAVDLRRSSPTFGRWVGETLSAAAHRQLWVPPGFAHGFFVTSESADLVYKCTDYYAPEHECTLRWDDPALGIVWPFRGTRPVLSAKDSAGLSLRDAPTFP
jgi:dTDP-4-dehydrorhamnose 3,5-epimerase